MNIWLLAGSLVAIMAIAAIVSAMGLGRWEISDHRQAMQLAEDHLPGFKANQALLSSDHQAALIIGNHDQMGHRIALIKRHGAHPAVRMLDLPLQAELVDGRWRIKSGDRQFGDGCLLLSTAESEILQGLLDRDRIKYL